MYEGAANTIYVPNTREWEKMDKKIAYKRLDNSYSAKHYLDDETKRRIVQTLLWPFCVNCSSYLATSVCEIVKG
jgi:hypothetical protein